MQYLFDGVKEFNEVDFQEHKELFESLGDKQEPKTLFISCCDSRIVPSIITKTPPGELFVVRNVANVVPIYHKTNEHLATTSAIEYAVTALNVENIIVCGHSNCGGCNAIYLPEEKLNTMPHVKKWLDLVMPVKKKLQAKHMDIEKDVAHRSWMTEQLNIVEQLKHLLTYPYVKERFREGTLNILGWYYLIKTGEIYNYNRDTQLFEKIE